MENEPARHWFTPYHFIVTFPDRVYPFSSYIDGQRVRWSRSYEHTLLEIQQRVGEGKYGFRLAAYREIFHILGAGIVILAGTVISKALWGSDVALPVLFLLAMAVITYQEFVLQPRTYNQRLAKGITDWFSWLAPLGLYLFLLS
jgi:hypothetical protein